ncbi:acyl-CoA thioesterase II [Hyphomicrobium sp.]|uniref:acyl-CoA thioesterase II n=1 Tax=Hyphomicrobium sp. TaxID=82 RepID=UPI0025BC8E92|nr:acyl-CoA thioesterase II [Hyphomicrobium sp.]MCC7253563.1 acyl-CoA thioesterase II [Hyphomicrobium sp.]
MSAGYEQPSPAVAGLMEVLDLERLEVNLFRGISPKDGWQRVYGGQVLGQALVAAGRTVEEPRAAHSLHGYFLLGGDPSHPIIYEVERIRDGGSFTTRRVKAIQHGRAIFAMSASFHKEEEGYEHAAAMPDVPPPETLPSAAERVAELIDALPENMRNYWQREAPIELRPVDVKRYLSREPNPPAQHIWLKASGRLPDDVRLHQCVLAYASDFTLLDTALIAHGKLLFDPDIQLASLDHALWLHQPFRADEWLLYAPDSPVASGARGFCRGSFFTRDGRLVASTAQEGLIRKRQTAFLIK